MNIKEKNLVKKIGLFLIFFCAIVTLTSIALKLGAIVNATTIGFSFLILVVISAVFAGLGVALATSITATLFFNYYFFPPIGTFRIYDSHNWVALFAFLFTSIVISRLTASAHQNAHKAEVLDTSLLKLKEFTSWLLSSPQELLTLSGIAENAVRIFSLEYCSIHVYAEGKWHHFTGTYIGDLSKKVADSLKVTKDHPTSVMELVEEQGLHVRYSQIRTGTEALALLAVKSNYFPIEVIDTLASIIGIVLIEALNETSIAKTGSSQKI